MWSDKESSEDYLNFGEVSQLAVDVLTTKDMLPVSMKWSTKTGHRVRVFSSIDFPIRLVVTHH